MNPNNEPPRVLIFTDGSCSGNPGPGGWGALIQGRNGKTKEIKGGALDTTNNRMELMATIKALEWLKAPRPVTVFTDSQYVKNGITNWIKGWKVNGWRSSNGQPIKNQDLWKRLDALVQHHEVDWRWVKAHSGDLGNERADRLARTAMAAVRQAA